MDMDRRSSVLECYFESEQKVNFKINLPIELTNITGTRIEHLNEYCMLEIFSVKSLDLLDMCSIAETCSRFQQIIQRIFPKKFALSKFCSNQFVYMVESESFYCQRLKGQDVERVMANFGVVLSRFSISSSIIRIERRESLDDLFLNAVTRNYFDNLESLQIRGFRMPGICTDKLKKIFKRIQFLELHFVCTCDATLFDGLDSLVGLTLTQVEGCSAILKNTFPKLERFMYGTSDVGITNPILNPNIDQSLDTLVKFISRHSALKALDLCFFSDAKCVKLLLQAIGDSCKEVMDLNLRVGLSTFSNSYLKPLRAFRSLRFLELWEISCGSFPFLSGETELRELHLHGCILPEEINHFSAIARLRKLVIRDCSITVEFDLVHVIDRLKNLEVLVISGLYHKSTKFSLSKNSLSKIVNVVRDRAQVLTLNCEFNFDLNDSTKCPKILLVYNMLKE